MSTNTATADAIAEPEPPFRVDELLDLPLDRGDAAVHLSKPDWYIVVRARDACAGRIEHHGTTVAEWYGVSRDADTVEAVNFDRLQRAIGDYGELEAVFAAVDSGLVTPTPYPERRLVRALEEFGEAKKAGEWSGLRDYLEVSR